MNNRKKSPSFLWLCAACVWTGLILFSSSSFAFRQCNMAFQEFYAWIIHGSGPCEQYGTSYETMRFIADKGLHLAMFFALALPLSKVFLGVRQFKLGYISLTGLIVGSASELLQSYFPGRDPAIRDVLLNLAGILVGAVWFLRSA